jgi:hypothetical protein
LHDDIMTWSLFIDDERHPSPRDGRNWHIARNLDEAVALIEQHGLPGHISFDHDLGDNAPTGYDIARRLVDMDLDGRINMPTELSFYVHEPNLIGKDNIEGLLKGYLAHKCRVLLHSILP